MESVAALSLACNVVQLVQFGCQTVDICKQLAKSGSPSGTIEEHRKQLRDLSTRVKASIGALPGTGKDLASTQLISLASNLQELTEDLETLLSTYQSQPSMSKLKASFKAIQYQFVDKRRMDELYKSLKSFERTLQSSILVELREDLKKLTPPQITALDQQTLSFASQLAAGITDLKNLMETETQAVQYLVATRADRTEKLLNDGFEATRNEAFASKRQIKDHIDMQLTTLHTTHAYESDRERVRTLLDSLKFSDMNARYNDIVPSHNHTFEWIYGQDTQGTDTKAIRENLKTYSDIFTKWLKSDDTLFWIHGKPGSGKSTLMKFLYEHSRTKELLHKRDPSALILAIFIWNAGSIRQRSLKMVVSSLLHQLLACRTEVARSLLKKEPNLESKSSTSDWSMESLKSAFIDAQHLYHGSLCIFIDGLDEIDHTDGEGQHNLLRLLHQLRLQPNLKLCVSSRPETPIKNELKTFPNWRLHDLTQHDIRSFVTDSLASLSPRPYFGNEEHQDLPALVDVIMNKADGVFLWARLVVSSIRNGLIDYDDWRLLMERIEALPGKLGELYEKMWRRMNDDTESHRARAALYLKLCLLRSHMPHHGSFDIPNGFHLLSLLIQSELSIQKLCLEGGAQLSNSDLADRCDLFQHQLLARCAGLVEVMGVEDWSDDLVLRKERRILQSNVRFIHKSVADFLLSTAEGHSILEHDKTPLLELAIRSGLSFLSCYLIESTFPDFRKPWGPMATPIIDEVSMAELQLTWPEELDVTLLSELTKKTLDRHTLWENEWVDYVCYAAERGAYHYVKKEVQEKPPPQGIELEEWKTLLLGSACRGVRKYADGNRELILWLLAEGANPNRRISSTRLWGCTSFQCFLIIAQNLVSKRTKLFVDKEARDTAVALRAVLCSFLDHGADFDTSLFAQLLEGNMPNQISRYIIPVYQFNSVQCKEEVLELSRIYEVEDHEEAIGKASPKYPRMAVIGEIRNPITLLSQELEEALQGEARTEADDKARAKPNETIPAMIKPLLLLMHRRDEGSREHYFTSKTVTEDEGDCLLMALCSSKTKRILRSRYHKIASVEMNHEETENWISQHMKMPTKIRVPPNLPSMTSDGSDASSRGPEGSSLDTSYDPTFSKLMEVISRIPKEDHVQEFARYCRKH